ncbi:type II toxin-antitoxin system RelE/ParE family toxin [Modicisalibacter zincidurans]|nr:type II toxin-antitoxin system RelE/ParE family toxin [Halomonas zincidurans]
MSSVMRFIRRRPVASTARLSQLKGFGSAGVLEVVEDAQGDTYRAVYTVKFQGAVYVLHCFQKNSSSGIATPKPDLDKIRERLKAVEQHVRESSS